jgi:FKBP-type peptidyl-prolyl cis-trans isomerase
MIKAVPVLMVILLLSCDPPVQQQKVPQEDPYKEQFIKTNRYMQRRNRDQIAAFVERVGWNALETPSGLWIVIEESGNGPTILENDNVTYTFHSALLDGTPCYEATSQNPKQIIVGKGSVESGVEEGLKHLNRGARAIFLIPPYLAHGNFGDRNRIPGNSVLIYSIEVNEVNPGR